MMRDLVLTFSDYEDTRVARFGKLLPMSSKQATRAALIEALHGARLKPYLAAASNHQKDALALYRWNVQLSAAFQELLSVTEVVLRNSMDRQLQIWNEREFGSSQSWLLEAPARPLKSLTQGKRLLAIEYAQKSAGKRTPSHWRYGDTVNHDDVLAQVMFGMWKEILPNHEPNAGDNTTNGNRARMWNEALIHAFPNVTDIDGRSTFWRVYNLHKLRNRVSHMESLLDVDTRGRTGDIFALVRSVSQPAHDWLTAINRVPQIVASRPC